nr:hypothetical protein Iba_chr14cCG0770 [Ipomoea batatas]
MGVDGSINLADDKAGCGGVICNKEGRWQGGSWPTETPSDNQDVKPESLRAFLLMALPISAGVRQGAELLSDGRC